MNECNKCSKFGFSFKEKYLPAEYIEGDNDSLIWIIGLNPKKDPKTISGQRTLDDLKKYFVNKKNIHPYFETFRTVSYRLYDGLGEHKGVAHTDIVKCASENFPTGKVATQMVKNCSGYLTEQIATYKPMMLICNGIVVSEYILSILLPPPQFDKKKDTSYIANLNGSKIFIILSGFVRYIDNYAKRRLGKEIECEWDKLIGLEMIETARELIMKYKRIDNTIVGPISLLQRHLKLGYKEAINLLEHLKENGTILNQIDGTHSYLINVSSKE